MDPKAMIKGARYTLHANTEKATVAKYVDQTINYRVFLIESQGLKIELCETYCKKHVEPAQA